MSDARKVYKPKYSMKIYLEGIDPNSEAGKHYANHREEISDGIVEALVDLAIENELEIIRIRPTFHDESDAITNELFSLRADKTFLGARILHHSGCSLKFVTNFLNNSGKFLSMSMEKKEEYLTCLSKISDDIKSTLELGKVWRSLPTSSLLSGSEALENLNGRVVHLSEKFMDLIGILPKHLQYDSCFQEIILKLIESEKQLKSSQQIFEDNLKGNNSCKELEALTERYLASLTKANIKFQATYQEMQDIYNKAKASTSKSTAVNLPPPPPTFVLPQTPKQDTPKPIRAVPAVLPPLHVATTTSSRMFPATGTKPSRAVPPISKPIPIPQTSDTSGFFNPANTRNFPAPPPPFRNVSPTQ